MKNYKLCQSMFLRWVFLPPAGRVMEGKEAYVVTYLRWLFCVLDGVDRCEILLRSPYREYW